MKIKNLTLSISFLLIIVVSSGCNDPRADAREVCNCYQKLIDSPKDTQVGSGFQKCMALSAEKTLKYKEKPKELLEFNIQLDSCTKSFSKKSN